MFAEGCMLRFAGGIGLVVAVRAEGGPSYLMSASVARLANHERI
jgi:hypothetical protein